MKKKVFALCLICLLLVTACGKADSDAKTEDTGRVEPLPATLSVDTIESNDCTFAASFAAADINTDGEQPTIHMSVYDCELFDMVDVSQLDKGSTLVIDGNEVAVESVETNDQGLVSINGGQENDGYDLYTEEDGVYYECSMDGAKNYHSIGEITLPLSPEFVFYDRSDLENPEAAYTAEEFLAQADAGVFTEFNTTVTVTGGVIENITRNYLP